MAERICAAVRARVSSGSRIRLLYDGSIAWKKTEGLRAPPNAGFCSGRNDEMQTKRATAAPFCSKHRQALQRTTSRTTTAIAPNE